METLATSVSSSQSPKLEAEDWSEADSEDADEGADEGADEDGGGRIKRRASRRVASCA